MLSDFSAFILHNIVGYRKNLIQTNLRNAFPEKEDKEILKIEREFYRHLCDVFIEAAKLAHISDKEIDRRIGIYGIEEINNSLKSGKSVILLLGHYGNWEWVTSAARRFIPGIISCEIYHPLSNSVFDKVMLDLRSRFGTENIPMKQTYRRLLEINKSGKEFVCGFIADQRPFTSPLKHWTRFLNQDTPYVNGGEVIGNKLGTDFFYVEMMPQKRGHYNMYFKKIKPSEDSIENPITIEFMRMLENTIRKNPSHWLWSHNRWKHHRNPDEIQN